MLHIKLLMCYMLSERQKTTAFLRMFGQITELNFHEKAFVYKRFLKAYLAPSTGHKIPLQMN